MCHEHHFDTQQWTSLLDGKLVHLAPVACLPLGLYVHGCSQLKDFNFLGVPFVRIFLPVYALHSCYITMCSFADSLSCVSWWKIKFLIHWLIDWYWKTSRHKALGLSGLVAEMIQSTGDIETQMILDLCNDIVKKDCIPEDWKLSVVLPTYKWKRDPIECRSCREIKLLESSNSEVSNRLIYIVSQKKTS